VSKLLADRLPELVYDPENGCTFVLWYQRYQDIITNDRDSIDSKAQARLIVSKLDSQCYARYASTILAKTSADLSHEETVKVYNDLFGSNETLFKRRIDCFQTKRNPTDTIKAHAAIVNRSCELAELSKITIEE